jgi:hypothetical protein
MEKLRISEKNNINNEINRLDIVIKRNKDTIKRLTSNNDNSDFNKKQIKERQEQILKNEGELILLNKKYNDISIGLLDEELKMQLDNNNEIIKKKQQIADKKVVDKMQQKQDDKDGLQNHYNNNNNKGKLSPYTLQKETDYFFKNCKSIPDYIISNLKDMPNSKGYIWRGIWCFGEKPKENSDLILFEKFKGGLLNIHEISRSSYNIYEKEGKNKKILISNEDRNPILSTNDLEKMIMIGSL